MKSTEKVLIPLLRCRIKGPLNEPIEQDKNFDLTYESWRSHAIINLSTLKIANVVKKFFLYDFIHLAL